MKKLIFLAMMAAASVHGQRSLSVSTNGMPGPLGSWGIQTAPTNLVWTGTHENRANTTNTAAGSQRFEGGFTVTGIATQANSRVTGWLESQTETNKLSFRAEGGFTVTTIATNQNLRVPGWAIVSGNFTNSGPGRFESTLDVVGVLGLTAAVSFPDGVRQTFNPNGTTPGFNFGSHTADPSTPINGDAYYNSTANELRARINGAWVALGAGGGGSDATKIATNAGTGWFSVLHFPTLNDATNNKVRFNGPNSYTFTTITASDIDWAAGATRFKTLTANTTFTFSNVADDTDISILLEQNTTGGFTVTWPAGLVHVNSTNQVVSSGVNTNANMVSSYRLYRRQGTNYLEGPSTSPSMFMVDFDEGGAGITSSRLAGRLTDETGSGLLVFGTSPTIITPLFDDYIELNEEAAPGTPVAGRGRLYAKADGKLYWKDDAGVEVDLTLGGAGGATAWDGISDPSASATVGFGNTEQTISSTLNGGGILTITNTVADLTVDTRALRIAFNDGADANAFYLQFIGDADGIPTTDFSVSQTAAIFNVPAQFNTTLTVNNVATLGNATTASTPAAGDNDGSVATTAFVISTLVASNYVTVAGAQTITGPKTMSDTLTASSTIVHNGGDTWKILTNGYIGHNVFVDLSTNGQQFLIVTNNVNLIPTNQGPGQRISFTLYNITSTNCFVTNAAGIQIYGSGVSNIVFATKRLETAWKSQDAAVTNIAVAFAQQKN